MVPAQEAIGTEAGARLQINVAAIEVDGGNQVVNLPPGGPLPDKEAALAVRNHDGRSVKARGPRHGHKQQRNFLVGAVTMGQHVAHVGVLLDVLRLALFLGPGALKGQVPHLLRAIINLAQLHGGIGLAADGLHGGLFYAPVGSQIIFVHFVKVFSDVLPFPIDGDFSLASGKKDDAGFVVVLRRHEFLALKGGDVLQLQLRTQAGRAGLFLQVDAHVADALAPGCDHGFGGALVNRSHVRLVNQVLFHREKLALDVPGVAHGNLQKRIGRQGKDRAILVFDDAADTHFRHAESFYRQLVAPSLEHHLFKRLAGELHNRAIGFDGSRLEVGDAFHEIPDGKDGNLHVGIGLAPLIGVERLFIQDLDALIEEAGGVIVIDMLRIIKPDRRRPFIAGHFLILQVLRSHRQPIFFLREGGQGKEQAQKYRQETSNSHVTNLKGEILGE